MHLYVHGAEGSEVDLIEDVDESARLGVLVVLEEQEFLFFEDDDEPVDVELTVLEIVRSHPSERHHHHHLHRHHCGRVHVRVSYVGRSVTVEVPPGATVERVRRESINRLEIDPVTGGDLVLRSPGSDVDLPLSDHIGGLVPRGTCSVSLDLVPGHREQG